MKKLAITGILAVLPVVSHAACTPLIDKQAFDLRALKSSLMVAALSCNQQAMYNQLIKKNDKVFTSGGELVKAYFTRTYRQSSDYQLTKFSTTLANNASNASMSQNPDSYCNDTAALFQQLSALNSNGIIEYADQSQYSAMHGMNACPAAQQYTQNTQPPKNTKLR